MIYYTNHYTNFGKDMPRYATICRKSWYDTAESKVNIVDKTLKTRKNKNVINI